ncbi:MAG: hypothetical protein WB697_04925 [Stellaceae bacterium]
MLYTSMPQPVTASCDLFAKAGRRAFLTEPDLGELMRDPMTEALMAADHVDRRELCALIAQMREHLLP